jgi:hypothetical protein
VGGHTGQTLLAWDNKVPAGLTYLNVLSLFCQPRFNSNRILTHRNIISSPPLKSMPNCTMSPSLIGNGLDSVPGGLSLMWFRNVPELLLTSLIYHLPVSYQNSQCRLLTTLLLNPTGAADGRLGGTLGWLSRSEYRPTRMTSLPVGRVRETGVNVSEGRGARGS